MISQYINKLSIEYQTGSAIEHTYREHNQELDECYNKRTFINDKECIEFLFGLYERYIEESQ